MYAKSWIGVLSGSKLNLSAIIPMLLEYTNQNIFVTVTSDRLKNCNNVTFESMPILNYPILYAEDKENIESLCNRMSKQNVRVAVINTSSKSFSEMLEKGNGKIWFSSCREGLFYYLPLIEKISKQKTYILCFDNDESLIKNAKEQCSNDSVIIAKCIAHSICSGTSYDANAKQIILYSGKECLLFFPPEANVFKEYIALKQSSFSCRAQLHFLKTNNEIEFFKYAKLVDINALHSFICIYAYIQGNNKGLHINEIAYMKFSDLMSNKEILEKGEEVHSILYDKYLSKTANLIGETKSVHTEIALNFIQYLYSSSIETVGRGLNPTDNSFYSKVKRHFSLLKDVNNNSINNLLEKFNSLL